MEQQHRASLFTLSRHGARRLFLCAIAGALCVFPGREAGAATHKKKSSSGSSSSSSHSSSKSHSSSGKSSSGKYASSGKRGSKHNGKFPKPGESKKHTGPPKPVALRQGDYPAEMSSQLAGYNTELAEIDSIRRKDPAMAKARGEVLKIKRDSFDLYRNYISSMDNRRAEKVRKAVASKGWYKGMPQIAFVVSMGLPDDIETIPGKNGGTLRLIYKKVSYFFEKGELRSVKK